MSTNITPHTFSNDSVNIEELVNAKDVRTMVAIAKKQAGTDQAYINVLREDELNKRKDGDYCPTYFGDFGEWFFQHFFNCFSSVHSITNVQMLKHKGSNQVDLGTDGFGTTTEDTTIACTVYDEDRTEESVNYEITKGGDVYIQVKATDNHDKIYQSNDGSRIMNFAANAYSTAKKHKRIYTSRFIVASFGLGLHYTLKEATNDDLQFVGIEEVEYIINRTGDQFFNYIKEQEGFDVADIVKCDDDEIEVIA